jgi:ParB family transcriptional regulator, chromosome partitioning protein
MDMNEKTEKFIEKKNIKRSHTGLVNRSLEIHDIPIEKIQENEFWIRSDSEEGLDSLAESIDKNGLQQFPAVRDNSDGSYTLIYGHRRYLSCKRLGHKTIPCYIVDTTAENAAFLLLIENLQRRQLHPIDEARTIKRFAETYKLKDVKIAKRLGWSPSVVNERLAVLKLPEYMLVKVGTAPESRITFTHLLALSKLWDPEWSERQLEVSGLYNKTIKYAVSTTELKALAALFQEGKTKLLPKNLLDRLIENRAMTAAIAVLYLTPESVIIGDSDKAKRMREIAQKFSKKKLEHLIVTSVEAEWSYEKTRQKFLDIVESRLQNSNKSATIPSSGTHDGIHGLVLKISELRKKLTDTRYEIEETANEHPKQLGALWQEIKLLHKQLNPIEEVIKDAFKRAGEVTSTNALVESTLAGPNLSKTGFEVQV